MFEEAKIIRIEAQNTLKEPRRTMVGFNYVQ